MPLKKQQIDKKIEPLILLQKLLLCRIKFGNDYNNCSPVVSS